MPSGREQLQSWIDRRFGQVHGRQSEAADLLGVDQSYLSQLLSGRRQPGLTTAVSIERLTGIPVEAWLAVESGGQSTVDAVQAGNASQDK